MKLVTDNPKEESFVRRYLDPASRRYAIPTPELRERIEISRRLEAEALTHL